MADVSPATTYRVPTNIFEHGLHSLSREAGDWRDKHGYFYCNQENYYSLLEDSQFF
jgi:hypothetical protein